MVMNAKEAESILYTKIQDEQIECLLCEMKTIGTYPFLCSPNFDHDRCKEKLGVNKFTGPCLGCFQEGHKLNADELMWFWEFNPFNARMIKYLKC